MMKNVVMLGCENSHAKQFADYIKANREYDNLKVIGCFSIDKEAQAKLSESYNIPQMSSCEELVKDAPEGVINTARHGDYHFEFIKPYMRKGITMFVDKPITCKEEDAIELAALAKEMDIKLTGGSSLKLDDSVVELKKIREEKGTMGGFVRSPISMDNPHGGFFFYSEHLVDIVGTIFGWFPKSVIARDYKGQISVTFKYDDFDVLGLFGKDNYSYSAGVFTNEGTAFKEITVTGGEKCFEDHFEEFYDTLMSNENKTDYTEFIAPVFILNAINKSLNSGKEEVVRRVTI